MNCAASFDTSVFPTPACQDMLMFRNWLNKILQQWRFNVWIVSHNIFDSSMPSFQRAALSGVYSSVDKLSERLLSCCSSFEASFTKLGRGFSALHRSRTSTSLFAPVAMILAWAGTSAGITKVAFHAQVEGMNHFLFTSMCIFKHCWDDFETHTTDHLLCSFFVII